MSVLFVCTGNTCRSPLAEALATATYARSDFQSAGLAALSGTPASDLAKVVARRHGLDLRAHKARGIEGVEPSQVDLAFGMTKGHCRALEALHPDWKVFCLGEFLADGQDIADPFGGDEEAYELCFSQIRQALGEAGRHFGWFHL